MAQETLCNQFEPTTNTSSATICKWCGQEKFMHNNQITMNKEEQKKLLTKIMHDDEKDGLYKNLTAVEWLVEQYANENYGIEVYEQAKQMEKELYEFRKMYNALLFNEWGKKLTPNPYPSLQEPFYHGIPKYGVHKSWRHNDGELCFGGGWFIVCAKLPTGQISNHYKAEDWDLFKIEEFEKALFEYDGHTPQDVLDRLKNL